MSLKILRSIIMLCCVLAAPGCSSMPQADLKSLAPSSTGLRVYLLRGITGTWSTGLDEMADTLNSQNIPTYVLDHTNWKRVLAAIEAHPQEKAVLIGHSLGADRALDILNKVEAKHTQAVALVITLDPVSPPKVIGASGPPVVNYYIRSSSPIPAFRGVEVRHKDLPVSNRVTNINLKTHQPSEQKKLTHFTIDNEPSVKQLIVEQVLSLSSPHGAK